MQSQLIVLFTILVIAFAKNVPIPREDEDLAAAFIECVRKALDGGLESALVPDHNPLHITRNLSLPIDLTGVSGTIKLENAEIDNIPKAEVVSIVGEYKNDHEIVYTVDFHFESMLNLADFSVDLEILLFPYHAEGTVSIDMQDYTLTVIWDQDTETKVLNNFTLLMHAGNVEVNIEGLGAVTDATISAAASLAILEYANNGDFTSMSEFLQMRFNTLWLDEAHWYRVDAILENCHAE